MKTLLYLLPVWAVLQSAPKTTISTPSTLSVNPASPSKSFFRFGDQLITLEKYTREEKSSYVLVSLHNEQPASIHSVQAFAHRQGAAFYQLRHSNKRMVVADLHDQVVSFDPNHIFTNWGRRSHLKTNKCLSRYAIQRVEQLAQFLVNEMVVGKTIVSVDNTATEYSIADYREGGKLEKEVKKIHVNTALDPYQVFLTADESIFKSLQEKNVNVVLQNKHKMEDTGALSVYCAKSEIPYVRIESRGNDAIVQTEMLKVVDEALK